MSEDKKWYVYEVIDLDLPEDRNIVWRSTMQISKRLSLVTRVERVGNVGSGVGTKKQSQQSVSRMSKN